MFNGLIKEVAKVRNFDGRYLSIISALKPELGDSIAINGACLSVVNVLDDGFVVEIGAESAKILATQNYSSGALVHTESALRFGDKIDGHLMQGHIDFCAKIISIQKLDNIYEITLSVPPKQTKFIAKKGSIAIDGVSLTINDVNDDSFKVGIIPITFENTIFKYYEVGRLVHIETDLFAKYTINYLEKTQTGDIWDESSKVYQSDKKSFGYMF